MADKDQEPTDPVDPDPAPPADAETADPAAPQQGLVYLGPDPTTPGAHQVLANGKAVTVPFEGLPDETKIQAINQAVQAQGPTPAGQPQSKGGGFNLDAIEGKVIGGIGGAVKGIANEFTGGLIGGSSPAASAPAPAPSPDGSPPDAEPQAIPTPSQPATAGGRSGGGSPSMNGDLANVKAQDSQAVADKMASANTTYGKVKAIAGETNDLQKTNNGASATRLQDFQAEQNEIYRQAHEQLAKAAEVNDEFNKMTVQPFPQSVGSRLLNALAFMVSGGASAVTHQSNMAADEYTKTVDNWLGMQKSNMEHKKEAATEYQNLAQKYLDLGMSRRQAFEATDKSFKDLAVQQADQIVTAHGGQEALAAFQNNSGGIREWQANQTQKFIQATDEHVQSQATVAHLNASTRHENAETAQLGQTAGTTASVRTGQQNLANRVPFAKLPPDQQQAVIANAQQNKMLIPRIGITQRPVEPAEFDKVNDFETARSLISDIDNLTKHTALDYQSRKVAAQKAQALQVILPKLLGSQARVSPGAEQALKNIVPDKPGDILEPWKAESAGIKRTLGEVQAPFEKTLGLTRFNPIQFHPDSK